MCDERVTRSETPRIGPRVPGGGAALALVLALGLPSPSVAGLTVGDNLRLREDDFDAMAFGADNRFGYALAVCDFNGDGFEDLAIGSPNADASIFVPDAGAVHVAYGSAGGLTLAGHQTLRQPVAGPDPPEQGDAFGFSLVGGYFDDNAFCDLAVGSPGEEVDGETAAGSVHVFYGSQAGLDTNSQPWSQNSPGIEDSAESGDVFGLVLAAGDFDADGFDDLVVSAVGEENQAGVVHVLRGSPSGLTSAGNDLIFQGDPEGTLGVQEAGDRFGAALAVGFFDGDTHADLAIGTPFESLPGAAHAGWLHVLYGESTGLEEREQDEFSQFDLGHALDEGDDFGASLAAGDFNGDGFSDLGIGSPGEILGTGAVGFLLGGPAGLSGAGSRTFAQDSAGVSDAPEIADRFATAIAAGDFDGDGYDDLGVGVPLEDFENGGHVDNGALHALYGTTAGLTALREQFHGQGGWNLGVAEDDDAFGLVLTAGDFDGDGVDSLVVGIPYEDLSGETDSGLVGVITGVFRDPMIFEDGFESGDTSAWDVVVD